MAISQENVKLIFGLKVRQLRLEKGLSFAQLSKQTGLSASYLNEIEKGKKYPKIEKINKLSETLEVSFDDLVSLQLSKKLAPLGELLQSNLFKELPLELFGIEPAHLLDLLSNAPAKLGAFLSTLIEISRNYGLRVESLYLNMLRSFQEMHDNYFESIEEAVETFRTQFFNDISYPYTFQQFQEILSSEFNYQVLPNGLEHQQELKPLRSMTIPGDAPQLLMNPKLTESQKLFTMAKELGYHNLSLSPRPFTSSWISVNSFEEVLNNYKASYFACALALPEKAIVEDLKNFLSEPKFNPNLLLDILETYQCTPEMLMHRMTNLLPKVFGIKELFFLRFSTSNEETFKLTKEMHLSGLHNPHGTALDQHYCRRWASIEILKELRSQAGDGQDKVKCKVQRSQYVNSDNEYLIISLAKPSNKNIGQNSSVSIGLLITPAMKRKVKFYSDPVIPIRIVNETCETCPLYDCQERAAPAHIYEQKQQLNAMKKAVELLTHQ
ncbi:XRE family transcriptional regulator [Marivirga salinae]|uniref:XRE family transcriptional regulator n=1 Tax=Marivirga salinarum TaxID=3059078 RepID=A0AA51RDY8_9BACT|nr:XRE family transcriptional regulator [Marivirga sp. BDSF4-3]WMN11369.1 XRE family transcriptional regulator [Marivirga sp. BDSF4-3]